MSVAPYLLLAALLGGAPPASAAPPAAPLSAEALQQRLSAACTASVADGAPVLLSFTASWCGDCALLSRLEADPSVAAALAKTHRVVVDVGRFEHHVDLLKAFGGDRLAWWVVLAPKDCAAPAPTWPVLRSGGLEPSGDVRVQTAAGVVGWLESARPPR